MSSRPGVARVGVSSNPGSSPSTVEVSASPIVASSASESWNRPLLKHGSSSSPSAATASPSATLQQRPSSSPRSRFNSNGSLPLSSPSSDSDEKQESKWMKWWRAYDLGNWSLLLVLVILLAGIEQVDPHHREILDHGSDPSINYPLKSQEVPIWVSFRTRREREWSAGSAALISIITSSLHVLRCWACWSSSYPWS